MQCAWVARGVQEGKSVVCPIQLWYCRQGQVVNPEPQVTGILTNKITFLLRPAFEVTNVEIVTLHTTNPQIYKYTQLIFFL